MDKNEKTKLNKLYNIDKEGSLGLLAYGDLGLRAWRKVKQDYNPDKNLDEEK